MDFSTITAMTGMPIEELAKLSGIVVVFSLVTLLVMGLSNKVVVFSNGKDLAYSLGIFVTPIIGFIFLTLFVPTDAPDNYDMFMGSSSASGITYTIIAAVIYCIFKTYAEAIKSNGMLLGLIIGTFKVFASILITLVSIGWISKAFNGEYKSLATWVIMVILLGGFGWVIKKLVNGEAVALKRHQAQEL